MNKQDIDKLINTINNEPPEHLIEGILVDCTTSEWLQCMFDKELKKKILSTRRIINTDKH